MALAVNRRKKTGPKQAGVCCGTGSPNDYHDSGGNSVSVLHKLGQARRTGGRNVKAK